ncbi:hypothetical protein ACTGXO_10825 [Streptococcus suis]
MDKSKNFLWLAKATLYYVLLFGGLEQEKYKAMILFSSFWLFLFLFTIFNEDSKEGYTIILDSFKEDLYVQFFIFLLSYFFDRISFIDLVNSYLLFFFSGLVNVIPQQIRKIKHNFPTCIYVFFCLASSYLPILILKYFYQLNIYFLLFIQLIFTSVLNFLFLNILWFILKKNNEN